MATNNFKIFLSKFILTFHDLFSGKGVNNNSELSEKDFESVVIFSTTALGDLMFNTPAIRAVSERYPNAKITLVSSYKNRFLVEGCPWFSNVFYWDQKINSLPLLIWKMRKLKPDLAILLHSKSPYDIVCASISGCRYIMKDSYSEKDSALKNWISVVTDPEFNGHLIERKLSLVRKLGCDTKDITMQVPVNYKRPNGVIAENKVIAFQLGASESLRCWPICRFQELARLLLTSGCGYKIALIGSPGEKELANFFLDGMSDEECKYITNYVGSLNLTELVEKIAGFSIVVTGDTGPLHLAVALQVPSVSLFVTANPDHTGPLQDKDRHIIIRTLPGERPVPAAWEDQPMAVITAEEVMSAIKDINS